MYPILTYTEAVDRLSITGLEKNNANAKRNYFSSSRSDAAADIIQRHAWRLSASTRERSYKKVDTLLEGSIEQSRAKQK